MKAVKIALMLLTSSNAMRTSNNQQIVRVDLERQLLETDTPSSNTPTDQTDLQVSTEEEGVLNIDEDDSFISIR